MLKKVQKILVMDKDMESASIARQITTWMIIKFEMNSQNELNNYSELSFVPSLKLCIQNVLKMTEPSFTFMSKSILDFILITPE